MKMTRRLSLRFRRNLAVGLLTIIALCEGGANAWQAQGDNEGARSAFAANATADLLLQAAGNGAGARGITNTALNGSSPATPETLAAIGQRRAAAELAVNSALDELSGGPDASTLTAGLDTLRRDLDGVRVRVDSVLKRPLAKDLRCAENPLATAGPGIRFYAGVRLMDGVRASCVIGS